MIRGARAAKRGPSWQDLRAVYSQTAVCGAFRMHGAHILPEPARFRMHGARILPRTGDFPVRGRFRDAWSAKLATDCRPGTHRGGILPRQGTRERIAREYCHCQSGQECIRAQSCRRRTLGGDAPWRNLVTTSRPRTHFAHILPPSDARERIASISCHRQTSENAQRRHTATAGRPVAQRSPREGVGSGPWLRCGVRRATLSVRGSGHSAFSGLNCWERFRVCAVSVGNHEPASRSAKLCRIMC